jgi:predicted regulator of amino acid metabolism with ACT domain
VWKRIIKQYFKQYPAQQKVVQTFLSYGLSIKQGRAYCADIELSFSKLARAIGVDRRAVMNTIETIRENKELQDIFSSLEPTCNFKNIASRMKWGVVEIIPTNASMPGILADIATTIADAQVSIRQANVDDYMIAEEPKLFIVTETPLPSRLIKKLGKAKGVKAVTVY